jgi:hypothetical protein
MPALVPALVPTLPALQINPSPTLVYPNNPVDDSREVGVASGLGLLSLLAGKPSKLAHALYVDLGIERR